ncbi:type II toxin-antitoxin system VapC family toxin [Synechocystis sp. PCC 7339]|uniref:type II toxin-antitoxin system VapC family toxin n=1 Tax=unclassified Synechocystis TaxID=2640012 RepID=UPI001BB0493B|nr:MULTISPECIES: type II toxin-antitoxin system VapC family toxin [unclassified Synechocystis]QUS59950.1 type II toxin-antitoxin system VapC family toxin [Synechocystis sp. PCC 7338]UAJ72593.1 type II toxin-antitoxin system VapC family toxin [Synechocystis sp. PCC 7339]
MIGVDTNILAGFYVNDPNDPEAEEQRIFAYKIFTESTSLFVPITVVLELEWVLRAFYDFQREDFARVIRHLLGLEYVTVEGWAQVSPALQWHLQGLDFADALHLAASQQCQHFVSFDDKRFARRVERLGLQPSVLVPK